MLDSQIAYSLRSEIRKKIFLQKLHLFTTANDFFEKITCGGDQGFRGKFRMLVLLRLISAWLDLLTHGANCRFG